MMQLTEYFFGTALPDVLLPLRREGTPNNVSDGTVVLAEADTSRVPAKDEKAEEKEVPRRGRECSPDGACGPQEIVSGCSVRVSPLQAQHTPRKCVPRFEKCFRIFRASGGMHDRWPSSPR